MYPSTHVFNQYYFELLKKIRDKARKRKFDSREARHVLKGMKEHYQTYDKSDDKYRAWFEQEWNTLHVCTESSNDTVTDAEPQPPQHQPPQPKYLYEGVRVSDVNSFFDKVVLEHFISILKIFMNKDMTEENTAAALKALHNLTKKPEFDEVVSTVTDEALRTQLNDIFTKHSEKKSVEMDDTLKRIENTSLGKLAKDIMSEINVQELENTMSNGDILSSLSNPDSSLTKVLSTVSAKMLSKMASGELQQETLLQDAMKLAGELGGLGGNKGGGGLGGLGGLGDMGEMIKQMQKMGMGGTQRGGAGTRRHKPRPYRKPNKPKGTMSSSEV